MNTVILTDQELEYLRELLQREIPNLHDEIRHTDAYDYREFLKERELLVKALVGKIGTPGSPATSAWHPSQTEKGTRQRREIELETAPQLPSLSPSQLSV